MNLAEPESTVEVQDGKDALTIPGVDPDFGTDLDLRLIERPGGRTVLCVHFRGREHCRATIVVASEDLLAAVGQLRGASDA